MKNLKVCTISKYPPYMSGHSFEAIFQAKALYEITGEKHHELTYDPEVYDKTTNYNDSPELKEESEKYAIVHRVKSNNSKNVKVFDGALVKAFIGKLLNLIEEEDINVLSTYYLDPHAYIANQAKQYAKQILNKDIIVIHKALGSDVLDSIGNHLEDGEAKFLLLQLLQADIMQSASIYTNDKVLEYAEKVLPRLQYEKLKNEMYVSYAPLDDQFFTINNEKEINQFKEKFGINKEHKIISYFGRLFPEKGLEDLITAFDTVKKKHPEVTLVIGGYGFLIEKLKEQAKSQGTPDIIFTGAVSNEEKRALMRSSYFGVIPTKPIANFVETLCVCAIEYQAAGAPLITTAVGGVPEAAGAHSIYAQHSNPKDLEQKMRTMLEGGYDRNKMIQKGLEHVKQFNYRNITQALFHEVEKKTKAM